MKQSGIRFPLHWSLFLLYSLVGLAACQTKTAAVTISPAPTVEAEELPTAVVFAGERLNFTTIALGEWGIHEGYLGREVALFLVQKAEDAVPLYNWITPEAVSQLQTLNYAEVFSLALFQGVKTTGGYGVTILDVVLEDDRIDIYARFQEPAIGMGVTEAATSPYHIIQAPKPPGWATVVEIRLIVDGEILLHLIP